MKSGKKIWWDSCRYQWKKSNDNEDTKEKFDVSYVSTKRQRKVVWRPKLLIEEVGPARVNRDFRLSQYELNYYVVLAEVNEK